MAARKGGLGKGLDSLIADKVSEGSHPELSVEKKADMMVPISKVDSRERILMKMHCWNYQSLSSSSVCCSHFLFRIRRTIMRLLPESVDGELQS